MNSKILLETNLPGLELLGRGKVRDVYGLDDRLLIVATTASRPSTTSWPPASPTRAAC